MMPSCSRIATSSSIRNGSSTLVKPRTFASIVALMLGAATVALANPAAQAQGDPEQGRGATDVEGRGPETGVAELPFAIDGPPPPALPQRISRDDSGRA